MHCAAARYLNAAYNRTIRDFFDNYFVTKV